MLTNKATLAALTIKRPTIKKKDNNATDEVADDKGANSSSVAVVKEIFSRDSADVVALTKVISDARTYHRTHTLPWGDKGDRVLPGKIIMDYRNEMAKLKSRFWAAAEDFISNVDSMKTTAKVKLGALYDDEDYLSSSDLRALFSFEIKLSPIATENDFRLEINEEELKQIKDDYKARAEKQTQDAVSDVWQRLHDCVEHMVERLSDPDKKFKNSLVNNIQDLVDLLPALNLTEDEDLTRMGNIVKDRLCEWAPSELRNNTLVRKRTADAASDILDGMQSYMGGPRPNVNQEAA